MTKADLIVEAQVFIEDLDEARELLSLFFSEVINARKESKVQEDWKDSLAMYRYIIERAYPMLSVGTRLMGERLQELKKVMNELEEMEETQEVSAAS